MSEAVNRGIPVRFAAHYPWRTNQCLKDQGVEFPFAARDFVQRETFAADSTSRIWSMSELKSGASLSTMPAVRMAS